MANLAVRVIVRVKEILIKAIIDIRANISIITLSVIKKLRITIRISDGSKIIAVDQIKKNVIGVIRDTSLSI